MSKDRKAALRAADKLLRLGKLRPAIDEYVRLVQADPSDLETRLVLASLHMRARDTDAALAEYAAIADAFHAAGDLARAADTCSRMLAVRADDERALQRLLDIALAQDRIPDARTYGAALADAHVARGDVGAAADTLAKIAASGPPDPALRSRIVELFLGAGQLDRAREYAGSAAEYRRLAEAYQLAGRPDEAIELLRRAVSEQPDHLPTVARLASLLVHTGDAAAAAAYLTPGMAGADPDARLGLLEILLRGGRSEEALDVALRLITDDPETVEALARLACTAAPHIPDTAFQLVDLAVMQWTGQLQWEPAAAALQQFVSRAPGCIDALVRLVEVAVDGDLTSTASHAQEMLADAYLARGLVAEGLAIAEDLAEREPGNPVHQARLRQAQELAARSDSEPAPQHEPKQPPTILAFPVSAAS